MTVDTETELILACLEGLKAKFGVAAVAKALGEADNHHNAATCGYCTENQRFVLIEAGAIPPWMEYAHDGDDLLVVDLSSHRPEYVETFDRAGFHRRLFQIKGEGRPHTEAWVEPAHPKPPQRPSL